MLSNIFIKCSIIDLISSFFNNFFKIDEKDKKVFYFKLFFYFEFNNDLRYRITFSIFLLNLLIKTFKKNLFII